MVVANQPDIVVVEKQKKTAVVIDGVVPNDTNIRKKEHEKLEKYQGLREELERIFVEVVGPSDPVVAIVGDDTVLPCHLDPAVNAADMTVEWTRSDLTPRFVHVWRDGVELVNKKNEAYMERTSLPINNLKLGDISLKLSKVKLSDRGSYKCFIPALSGQASVDLVVGVVSSLIITVMRNSEDSSKVVLQCESAGWYPEPELLWLDGEGNLLSAGPTETLRGPDDLYTVSSRVTVEKRHSNNITCRVQQRNTNQSRETHIHVPVLLVTSS
ncbi:butyrophilin subfamily 2 member A2-like [Pelmatolapia mariae]|uniref:butyrophilin subfamily 2 member A2-like n=1 Tax=Pelmatolapia mariae TaxID=158779 RepID=UPI003211D889